ncbi:hypothetical protein EYF80_014803 [Liparis tanakae]|uniref:Uncharacterized protein n=1 Tax=Liparis tanakae TaxID=230148 RepID=A0A4Z2IAS1_9TELE|nr:hypothetical protein EYF80_014803 [Liparis tanakae]
MPKQEFSSEKPLNANDRVELLRLPRQVPVSLLETETGAAFLGRPRFLLFSLRALGRRRARRGLAVGLTTVTRLGRSSSPQESCCSTHRHTHMFRGGGTIAFTVLRVLLMTSPSHLLLLLRGNGPI